MLKRNKHFKTVLAILAFVCILTFISAYAFTSFLSHSHECAEADCSVCTMMQFSRNMLIEILLSVCFCQSAKMLFVLSGTSYDTVPARDGTPVALKVKLSD